MNVTDILGDEAQHQYTQTHGLVTGVAEHLTGCERVSVLPKHVDYGEHAEEEWYHVDELVFKQNDDFAHLDPVVDVDFDLGNTARDTVTGVEGIVAIIAYNLFNCPRAAVLPELSSDEQSYGTDVEWFDAPRLEVVDEGVTEDFDELLEDADVSETGPIGVDSASKPTPSGEL